MLARKNLSIPRLELVVAHMSANLVENVKTCLNKQKYMGGQIGPK